jgi:mRNA interferase RelE/StbE
VPIRVELTNEALGDLERYVRSGNLDRFLAKLVRLEEEGPQVGQPLRGELHGFRKIVVGDRNWRIIFRANPEETIATVWVIGDRADSACYDEAAARVAALGQRRPEVASLAVAILRIFQEQQRRSRGRRR